MIMGNRRIIQDFYFQQNIERKNEMAHSKGIIHPPIAASSLEQSPHQFLPVWLVKILTPISYKTNKRRLRRRRYIIDDEELLNAARTLQQYMSHGGYEGSTDNLDVNHRDSKRQTLSCNMMDDNEKMKEQGVLLTSGHVVSDIDQMWKDNSRDENNLVLRLKNPKDEFSSITKLQGTGRF